MEYESIISKVEDRVRERDDSNLKEEDKEEGFEIREEEIKLASGREDKSILCVEKSLNKVYLEYYNINNIKNNDVYIM